MPPSPFLAKPVDPPIPWSRWIASLCTFLTATDLIGKPEKRKVALLRHSLGAEGQRLAADVDAPTFEKLATALERVFKPRRSAIWSRHLCRQRTQHSGENVQSFVSGQTAFPSNMRWPSLNRWKWLSGIEVSRQREQQGRRQRRECGDPRHTEELPALPELRLRSQQSDSVQLETCRHYSKLNHFAAVCRSNNGSPRRDKTVAAIRQQRSHHQCSKSRRPPLPCPDSRSWLTSTARRRDSPLTACLLSL